MKKQSFYKDLMRTILKSKARFLSILTIIALGVGFFAGINGTEPDMLLSADKYFKQNNLSDIKILAPLGFKDEDIAKIKSLEGIGTVQVGYSSDLFMSYDEGQTLIVKVMSYSGEQYKNGHGLNIPVIVEGRMPENSGEIAVEKGHNALRGFSIGSQIRLSTPEKEDIGKYLNTDSFTVVGIIQSPLYIDFERGQTNIGDGSIDAYAYLWEEDFRLEKYTDLYISTKEADAHSAYSDDYKAHLEPIQVSIEETGKEVMAREIRESRTKLDDARRELEDNKKKVDYEFADAEKKLLDSQSEIEKAEEELKRNEQYLAGVYGQSQILKAARDQLQKGRAELDEGWKAYEELKADTLQKIADAEKKINDNEKLISKIPEQWFVSSREGNPGYAGYGEDTERIGAVARVFPLFFFLVAALVCLTTMTRMVEEERAEIGTLKALGYSTLTISSKYLVYALLSSLLGTLLGLSIGFKLFPTAIMNAYGIMYNIPVQLTPFHLNYALISLLLAVVTTISAALLAALQELRAAPASLIQPKAPKPGKRVLLERITPLWSRMTFLHKVTARNIFRYKRRFLMTVIGISGCTALLLTGFGLKNSINDIMGKQFDEIFVYDGQIMLDMDKKPEERELAGILGDNSEVLAYLEVYNETGNAISENSGREFEARLFIPEELSTFENFIKLHDRKTGKNIRLTEDGAVITEKLSKLLNVRIGETISYRDGNNITYTISVADIAENYFSHYIFMTTEYFDKISSVSNIYNSAVFNISDAAKKDEDALMEELMNNTGVLGGMMTGSIANRVMDTMESLDYVVLILIISAGALAFVVLYNLTNINITERIREIATIKVLGFRDQEVSAYVYRENMLLTLFGTLGGLLLGIWLHKFVIRTMEIDNMMFGQTVHLNSYFYSILLTFFFSALVNMFMHYKLKTVNMVESLKSVE